MSANAVISLTIANLFFFLGIDVYIPGSVQVLKFLQLVLLYYYQHNNTLKERDEKIPFLIMWVLFSLSLSSDHIIFFSISDFRCSTLFFCLSLSLSLSLLKQSYSFFFDEFIFLNC